MPAKISKGLEVETVGDILGDRIPEFLEVEHALDMPRIDGTPGEPAPGIYFGMSEEDYHRLPCMSNSHARNMASSQTLCWAESWLNSDHVAKQAERDADEKYHRTVGKAYHAAILEGLKAYQDRFFVKPVPEDHPNALRLVDEIKGAIKDRGGTPVSKVDDPRDPTKQIPAKKDDWVAQLRQMDRTVEIWEVIERRAALAANGRAMVHPDDDHRIRVAARMIAQEPELGAAFRGGYPEVTLVWRDPRQGVLCKARVDYLKLKAVVDLKSFENRDRLSIRNAVLKAIANHRYCLQPAVYLQGVEEVRKLVRADPAAHIHLCGSPEREAQEAILDWTARWASFEGQDRWLWVFQQKGAAPVTRGMWYQTGSTAHAVMQMVWIDACRRFRSCTETFGTDPWLDLAEIDEVSDGDIPPWGLDI